MQLFRGEDRLFKHLAQTCESYFEFGAGDSTIWMAANTSCPIFSVETSHTHYLDVLKSLARPASLVWVDLGPVGDWGRPLTYEHRARFSAYAQSYSTSANERSTGDLVLIDGRFRVSCFLYSLVTAPLNARLLFDDYRVRPHYHLVSEFLRPIEFCGDQALFIKEAEIPDADDVLKEALRFSYVME